MPLRGLPRRVACRASGFRRGSALRVSARPARHSRRSNGLAAKTCPPRPRRGSRRGCPARGARRPPGRAAISRIGFAEHRAEGSRDAPRARERSRLQMNAIAVFEERRRELDTLLAELNHVLWQRGIPAAADADGAPCDQQASLCELVERLEREVHTLPARKSVRLLAGIVFRAAQARLQAFATLAGRLSEAERARLAALLRLGEQERRGIATLLRLPEGERRELAIILGLPDVESQVLATFVANGEAEVGEGPTPEDAEASPDETHGAVIRRTG